MSISDDTLNTSAMDVKEEYWHASVFPGNFKDPEK